MNGYSNDDTYAAVVVLDNDDFAYTELCRMARRYDADESVKFGVEIKKFVVEHGIFADEYDIDLDEVDFEEIAASYLDDE